MRSTSLVIGALVVQAAIVTVMLIKAVMPLWTGQEVLIMARAVDPRDLMRGDYVALDYDIKQLKTTELKSDLKPGMWVNYGDELYVTLRTTDSGAVATGVYRTPPQGVLIIKGRPAYRQRVAEAHDTPRIDDLHLSYGIEEFYTDPQTAQLLDRRLRSGTTLHVHLMIDNDGNARIRSLGD